jgi:flavin reductase (DIM6/NTAB) family NADH-FMN oxidoreductase RutF
MAALEFRTIEPKILYFRTPVALISSLNEDGATNLAPRSSSCAPGWTLVPGVLDETKTAENLARHIECVVNIVSPELCNNVEELAPLTGKNPVPETKAIPFRAGQVQKCRSDAVREQLAATSTSPRMPGQMEARVQNLHRISGAKLEQLGGGIAAEIEIVRVHVANDFVLGNRYIDPAKWSPLIYNFRHYFRLAEHELGKTFRAER